VLYGDKNEPKGQKVVMSMKHPVVLGLILSLVGTFLFVGPPDLISKYTYCALALVIYATLFLVSTLLAPAWRRKRNGLWMAIVPAMISILLVSGYARLRMLRDRQDFEGRVKRVSLVAQWGIAARRSVDGNSYRK